MKSAKKTVTRGVAFAVCALAVGCGHVSTSEPDTADGGMDCNGYFCGSSCVDLETDPENCGLCGKACASGLFCNRGVCAVVCAGGTTKCADRCADLATDPAHCGNCEKKCGSGEVCSAGLCGLTCSGGATKCGDRCVGLGSDPANCGACGMGCDPGFVCSMGTCSLSCAGGTTKCDDRCVDTSVDPSHCGACDNSCPEKAACEGGACQCPSETPLACGDICIDPTTDGHNCGTCGNTCGSGKCENGKCLVASDIAVGDRHACAIVQSGELRCWGDPLDPGIGPVPTTKYPNVVALLSYDPLNPLDADSVTARLGTTCVSAHEHVAMSTSVQRYWSCWGAGYVFKGARTFGPAYDENGPSLLATGNDHFCRSLPLAGATPQIGCTGLNDHGQLGGVLPTTSPATTPTALDWPFSVRLTTDTDGAVYFSVNLAKLVAGPDTTCALSTEGGVWCWGKGPIGDGTAADAFRQKQIWTPSSTTKAAKDVALSGTNGCIVDEANATWCWGAGGRGQLGTIISSTAAGTPLLGPEKADSVAVGNNFVCVLRAGKVRCLGDDTYGQLGNGPTTPGFATAVDVVGMTDVTKIVAGSDTACALKKDGSIWCWGASNGGLLGAGSSAAYTDAPVKILW